MTEAEKLKILQDCSQGKLTTREALYPHELSDELKAGLTKGYKGRATPELNHLME